MGVAASSTEYVHVPIVLTLKGDDVTPSTVKLAFLTGTTNPGPADWHTAEYIEAGQYARLLIGPEGGSLTLTKGVYWVWATWTAGLETPVYRAPERLGVY